MIYLNDVLVDLPQVLSSLPTELDAVLDPSGHPWPSVDERHFSLRPPYPPRPNGLLGAEHGALGVKKKPPISRSAFLAPSTWRSPASP